MEAWYALHAKPHKERQASDCLSGKGLATYLPMLAGRKKRQGRYIGTTTPLFPCYLFVLADLDLIGISPLRWTPGLRDLVRFGNQPAWIECMQARLADADVQQRFQSSKFHSGQGVRVSSGPLGELEAIFERALPGHVRAQILIDILGCWTVAEVDTDDLISARSLMRVSPARCDGAVLGLCP